MSRLTVFSLVPRLLGALAGFWRESPRLALSGRRVVGAACRIEEQEAALEVWYCRKCYLTMDAAEAED